MKNLLQKHGDELLVVILIVIVLALIWHIKQANEAYEKLKQDHHSLIVQEERASNADLYLSRKLMKAESDVRFFKRLNEGRLPGVRP